VESVLREQDGVISADATYWKNQAVVEYDPKKITLDKLIAAVNDNSPYRASIPEGSYSYASLSVAGSSGLKEINDVANVLYSLSGVKVSAMDPFKSKVYLEYQEDKFSLEDIVETATRKTGYKLIVASGEIKAQEEEAASKEDRKKLIQKLLRRFRRNNNR